MHGGTKTSQELRMLSSVTLREGVQTKQTI